jgi:hypothetical protein
VSAQGETAGDPRADAPIAPRRRRWRRFVIVTALLLSALSLLTTWLLQPRQLVPLVLDRAGSALSLELSAAADAEARLRGEPQLVVRDLVVREPGADTAILRADRVLLALPWSSLRDRDAAPVIERIELDAPVLNLPALQAWLDKRPPAEPPQMPTLTDGLRVVRGRIEGGSGDGAWRVEDLALDLPALYPDRPLQARIRGRYADAGTLRADFDLAAVLSRPADGAGLALTGPVTIADEGWRMPTTVNLSGPLFLTGKGFAVRPLAGSLAARYESDDMRLPFALGLHGPLDYDGATWTLAPVALALRGEGPIPRLDARGGLGLGRRLAIRLAGELPRWPERWPALPPPVAQSPSPLPFSLRYTGAPAFTDLAELALRRDATTFDARFRLNEVLDWTARSDGPPLPPMDGRLTAPRLEVSGATLEGVEVTLDDESIP